MTAAHRLARSVREWLEMLDREQRAQASYPFATNERVVWAYTPGDRGGSPWPICARISAPRRCGS